MALLCGIDVGTTGTKAVLYTDDGGIVAQGYEEYGVQFPAPGWAEQDSQEWWRATCNAVSAMLSAASASGASARDIAAVAVSSQAPTMLPLDARMRPLRRALIWMDRRADGEATEIAERFGAREVFELTGNRCDPYYVAPKILWFRNNEPEEFGRTRWFAPITGYLNYCFTGALTMDPVHAALLGLRRWSDRSWSEELCNYCGVEPRQFPVVESGEHPIGGITTNAAAECGLAEGTPVVSGTVDGAAAALEAGALMPGTAAEMTGTSTVLLLPNTADLIDPSFIAIPHAIEGISLLLGAMSATGASLKWFRDSLGESETRLAQERGLDAYDLLVESASSSPPGSDGVVFLPYMMGERAPIWDSTARGVFFGLTLSASRGDIIRSILEGAAFALRHNVEVARGLGIPIDEMRSVGGGARSELWNQIKADVLGIPIVLPERSGGAPFGDAVLAGMGAGLIDDPREFISRAVGTARRYVPSPENSEVYSRRYETYRAIYDSLKPVFEHAAAGRKDATDSET